MAVKMQKEFGDKLNTIFVECQGNTMETIQKLALKRKWLGSSAMWTTERPVRSKSSGLPGFVLLSPEGRVVMDGNPIVKHKEIEDYLSSLRRQKTKVPGELPKPLHSAFKNRAKGKLGAALIDAEKLAASTTQDEALKAATADFLTETKGRIQGQLARIDRAIEAGSFEFAAEECKRVGKLIRGSSMEAALEQRKTRLDSEELATAIKAEKALLRVTDRLYNKGSGPATARQLEKLASKYEGTKAADRATELAGLLE